MNVAEFVLRTTTGRIILVMLFLVLSLAVATLLGLLPTLY
jgi:hypothetical protein